MSYRSSLLIRRLIRDVLRTLNIPGGVILLKRNAIGDKDVAERKFLQETNFQEDEFDEDLVPERRALDQLIRPNYLANEKRPDELRKEQQDAYIKSFLEE